MANIDHEYSNFSKAARIILELNTKVLREYLTTVKPPKSLPQSILNLKVLNQSQKTIVLNIFNILSYDECDSSLLYILIRNSCNITPVSGWCKPVKPCDTNVGDDVERMRILRNELYGHATTARLSNGDYNSFIKDVRGIMVRFDSCHGGTYQRCLSTGTFENELININTIPLNSVLQKHYNTLLKVKTDLVALYDEIDRIDDNVNKTDTKVDAVKKDVEVHDTKIDTAEKELIKHEVRMDDIEKDCVKRDTKIVTLENNFTEFKSDLKNIDYKIESLVTDVVTMKEVILKNHTTDTAPAPHDHNHELEYVYRMNWVCKKCDISYKNKNSYYCMLCDYGECVARAGEKQITSIQCTKDSTALEDHKIPHCHSICGTWSITSHHNRYDGPIKVLKDLNRETFISKEKKNQEMYESGFVHHYTETEFDKVLKNKFLSTFSPEFEKQPWLMTNLQTVGDESRNFLDICGLLNDWCKDISYSFLVVNYSLEDHVKKLGIDLRMLKKELNVYENEDESKRILLYRGDIETLFIIRCTDSTSKEEIDNEVIKGNNDLKLISTLHLSTLTKSKISIVSMVVASSLTDKDLSHLDICKECINESLVISKDDITTHLDHIAKRMQEKNSQGNSLSVTTKENFLELASRIIGFIAIEDVNLPNITGESSELLARIYLNKAQRDFLYSKRKHLILQGGFGSGKTILGQLRFKQIIQTADPDDYIYLIVYSNETLLRNLIQSAIEEIPKKQIRDDRIFIMNCNEYCQKFELISPLLVSDILKDITKRHEHLRGIPHLIVDELEGSSITENEGKTIKECLKKLPNSFVLLITHSLEIIRKKVLAKYYLLTEKQYYNGFHYEATGMKITILDQIMRNSNRINALAQSAIETLKGSVNVFQERQIDSSSITTSNNSEETDDHLDGAYISSDEDSSLVDCVTINANTFEKRFSNNLIGTNTVPETLASTSSGREKDTAVANIDRLADSSLAISTHDFEKKYYRTSDIPNDIFPGVNETTSGSTIQNDSVQKEWVVSSNMDHVLKHMNTIPGRKSNNRIISKFNFPGAWNNGHGVEGEIPVLYYPFENNYLNYDNINNPDMRARLCYVLKHIIALRSPIIGMGIICFEIIDSLLFYEVLKALGFPVKLYTPAMDAKTKPMNISNIRDVLKTNVIITDHIGSRGLEFKKLILCVNPNETFLHQYLLEGMTRCIYELHIIVINKESKDDSKNIACGKIIKNWIKAGLVKKEVITTCVEKHNEGNGNIKLSKALCKEDEDKHLHFIHPLHNSLKVPLVSIKKVTVDFGRCFDIYYAELSNTQHIDDLTRRKQNEYNIQQKCQKQGFLSYLDVIRRNKSEVISYLMKKEYDDIVKFRDFKGRSLLDISIEVGAEDSAISFMENGMSFEVSFQQFKNAREYAQYLGRMRVVKVIDDFVTLKSQYVTALDKHDYVERLRKENQIKEVAFILREFPEVVTEWKRRYESASDKYNHVKGIIQRFQNEELNQIMKSFPEIIGLKGGLHGYPIFHLAAWRNNKVSLETLISNGADVYEVDGDGYNILHNIVLHGNDESLECLEFLATKYNKLVRGEDKIGQTPIDVAKIHKKDNMLKVLENIYGAEESAMSFIENGMPFDISSQQIENGSGRASSLGRTKHVKVIDDNVKKLYEGALSKYNHVEDIIRYKRNEELKHILANFPKVIELKGGGFVTPLLHIAAWTNNMVAMEMLISNGADIYEVDRRSHNILHNIASSGDDDSLECFQYIATKFKKLVKGKDKFGRTPIEMAKKEKKYNMVKVLKNVSSE